MCYKLHSMAIFHRHVWSMRLIIDNYRIAGKFGSLAVCLSNHLIKISYLYCDPLLNCQI